MRPALRRGQRRGRRRLPDRFPALLAVDFPPLPANLTNSVAQWPGYLGAVAGQREELRGQRGRALATSGVAVEGVLASIYGGYSGGALGVILIAVLGLFAHDALVRLNGMKTVLSPVVATVTVVIFALCALVHRVAVALTAPATLVGGHPGARLARRLPDWLLRWSVGALGVGVAVYLVLRQ